MYVYLHTQIYTHTHTLTHAHTHAHTHTHSHDNMIMEHEINIDSLLTDALTHRYCCIVGGNTHARVSQW
jgi:hypothetical protein